MIVAVATAVTIPIVKPNLYTEVGWVNYAGAFIALLAFLAREFSALRTLRKQHTVSVLLQSRLSTAFNDRYKVMIQVYPVVTGVTAVAHNDWKDPNKVSAIEALKYFLNYYEFIAIGIRNGDLDEDYLYKSLKSIVSNLWTMGGPYITELRSGNPRIYKNLLWLVERWEKRGD